MAIDRNSGDEVGIALDEVRTLYHKAVRIYKISFILLVIVTIVLVMCGVRLNQENLAVINFTIAAAFLVVWVFFTFYPAGLLTVAGVGGLEGLPKNWSLNKLIRLEKDALPDLNLSEVAAKGLELVKQYVRYSAHIAYFAIVVFTVMGSWRIKDPVAILPLFVLLAGVGLYVVLANTPAKWYFRITLGIILVSIAMFLYRGFLADKETPKEPGGPSSSWAPTTIPAPQAVVKSAGKLIDEINYQERADLTILDRGDQRVCTFNFPEGRELQFKFASTDNSRGEIFAKIQGSGQAVDLADYLRAEGVPQKSGFRPKGPKCITFTHAVVDGRKSDRLQEPRIIGIIVSTTPLF